MTTLNITATLEVDALAQIIADVTAAEKITKKGLSVLSRELLAHAWEHGDITLINDLMGTDENGKFRLTPLNWRVAAMYFNAMVAFTSNYEKEIKEFIEKGKGKRVPLVFNKKSKDKYKRMGSEVEQWLSVESNDLWVWSEDVEMSDPTKDYAKLAINAVKNAIDDNKGGLPANYLLMLLVSEIEQLDLGTISDFLSNPVVPTPESVEGQV